MRILALAAVAAASIMTSGCPPPPTLGPEIDALETQLGRYRTAEAFHTMLGAYGEKIMLGGRNPIELVRLPDEGLDVRHVTSIEVSTEALQKFGAKATVIAQLDANIESSEDGKYTINIISIKNPDQLREIINHNVRVDEKFAQDIGSEKTRIVSSIAVIFNHSESRDFSRSFNAQVRMLTSSTEDFQLEVASEGQNKRTFSLADATVVAYQTYKLCWSSDGELAGVQVDRDGSDPCRSGLTEARPMGNQ